MVHVLNFLADVVFIALAVVGFLTVTGLRKR